MKVDNSVIFGLNFKGARINIVENSDNHGNLNNLPDFYNAIKQNQKDIFKKSYEPSTLNLYINAGDFFMNPSKNGWLSFPKKTSGTVQKEFFELLIKKIQKVANTECYEKNKAAKAKGEESNLVANFDALYTPGNHCYDGGDKILYKLLRSIKGLTTVMTNVDIEKSPLFKTELNRKNSNFTTKKTYEIPDDKDPNKKHHLMVLGATIPAMDFYNPGLLEGTEFCDNTDQKDSGMGKENIKGTIKAIRKEVRAFKKEHPKGIVILSSHMGTELADIIRKNVAGITEILDGHKHDIMTSTKLKGRGKGTTISSLGMDNDIVKSISLIIDDKGDIEDRESRTYSSDQYRLEKSRRKENALQRLLTETYKKDYEPLLRIYDDSPGLHSFEYKPEIRYANSCLANFLTTSVKKSITQIKGQEDVAAVGIQSSIIRGGIKDGSNNFDVLRIFDGVSEDLSDVKVGTITGYELAHIIFENIKDNIKKPDRNTIIHWSDIKVNRSAIEKALKANPDLSIREAARHIETRDSEDSPYRRINLKNPYKIAIADKYLKKTDIKAPIAIKDRFESIGQTYHKLFKKYLCEQHYQITMEPKHREDRIV